MHYSKDRAHEVNAALFMSVAFGHRSCAQLQERILLREANYAGPVDTDSPKEQAKYRNHSRMIDKLLGETYKYLAGGGNDSEFSGLLGEQEEDLRKRGFEPDHFVTERLGLPHSLEYLRTHLPDQPALISEAIETLLCVKAEINPSILNDTGVPENVREDERLDIPPSALASRMRIITPILKRIAHATPEYCEPVPEIMLSRDANDPEPESLTLAFPITKMPTPPVDEQMLAQQFCDKVNSFPNIRLKAELAQIEEGGPVVAYITPARGTRLEMSELFALADQLEYGIIEEKRRRTSAPPWP